jgi:hypothetical protein
MHTIFAPFDAIFSALSSFSSTLSAQFAQLVCHPLGLFGAAAIVVASLALAVGCAAWAILERARRSAYRQRIQAVLRRSQLACHFRDAILETLPETVVVLRAKAQKPLSYGGGGALLQQCLDGPDAAPLATAINDLLRHSSGFSLSVRLSGLRHVFVRGVRVGGGAALFLRAQDRFTGRVTSLDEKPRPSAAALRSDGVSVLRAEQDTRQTTASHDGVVIIGADGRLKKYNQAFAKQWLLRDDELRGEPLWTDVAARGIARNGRDAIWDIVSYAAASADPERLNDWGTVMRGNGKRLSLSISRLKDGATLVRFSDASLSPEARTPGTRAMAA